MALCPAHDDHSPSLSIKEGENGHLLVHCFADCPTDQVCAVLGITPRELGPIEDGRSSPDPRKPKKSVRRIVATYDYTDEEETLLFQVVRFEPKYFCQRRPDGKGGWIYNLGDTRRVVYRLPRLINADKSETLFIAEGEKDTDRLLRLGVVATTNPGGAGKWRNEYTEAFRDRHVCLLPHNDLPGSRHAEAVANSLISEAASVRIVLLPNLLDKGDVSDWLDAGGTVEALKRLCESAPLYESTVPERKYDREIDERMIRRLALLPPLEYERERVSAAKSVSCRTVVLDKLVKNERLKLTHTSDGLQGHSLNLEEIDPWPESVNGSEVLHELAEVFSRYIALPGGAPDALALWCAHTHAFDEFVCSPRLNISSPDKQCGKTTLRDVVGMFVPRALETENLSVAVLFRITESHKPTLLADECDAWLRENEELRGLLNAGHRRGGKALRCEGEGNEVRAFSVFAPAVLCGIGSLPGTLHDRSIVIRLARAKPGEVCERFDSRRTQREKELASKLARFCTDNRTLFGTSDPELPAGVFNRLADNWRPLFAVAEIAGGEWPRRVASAFAQLSSRDDMDAQGLGVMLLTDIQKVFEDVQSDRLFSKELVARLCSMTDRTWPEAHRGRPITEAWLARRLRPFDIRSSDLRIGPNHAKGYERTDFAEAFDRYLFPLEHLGRDNVTVPINTVESAFFKRDNSDACHGRKSDESTENISLSRCHALNTTETDKSLVVGEI